MKEELLRKVCMVDQVSDRVLDRVLVGALAGT